jgi:hypothetical protein
LNWENAAIRGSQSCAKEGTLQVEATKPPARFKRCLRRIIARQLFRLLERYDQPGIEVLRTA